MLRQMGYHGVVAGSMLAIAAIVAGCASKPPPAPFLAPPARTEASHFEGTPLSGPTTRPIASVTPDKALAVRVRVVAMERGSTLGQPLAAAARLIAADRLGSPMLPAGRLTRGGRLVELKDPAAFESTVTTPTGGRSANLWQAEGAVAAGVTASFVVIDPKLIDPRIAGSAAEQKVEIYVGRPAASSTPPAANGGPPTDLVEIAVMVQALAPLQADSDASPADKAAAPLTFQREAALVIRQVGQRDVVAITLPFQFSAANGQTAAQAVGLIIDIARDDGSPAHLEALSRAVEDGRKAALKASVPLLSLGGGRSVASGVSAAFDSLTGPTPANRALMVYVAGQAGAHLTEDVALVADEATLAALRARLRELIPGVANGLARPANTDLPALGWQLDKATFGFLGQLVSAGKLPVELNSVLSVYTGEAGRHPNSFEEIGRLATGRADFDARLIGENLIYLEDASPSSRVRAFDWLKAKNQAPAGFDPLGDPKERRLALERAANAPANPAPNPTANPAGQAVPAAVVPGGQP